MTEIALQSGSPEIPDKLYFKIGEVSDLLGVEPYVLRYWETEFSVLSPKKSGTGHRLYRRKDVELLLRIKHLLYEKRFTIEGARKYLESRGKLQPVAVPEARKNRKRGVQANLFDNSGAAIDTVRKELREILKMLK